MPGQAHTHTYIHIYVSNEFLLCSSGVNWSIYILYYINVCAHDVHVKSLRLLIIINVHTAAFTSTHTRAFWSIFERKNPRKHAHSRIYASLIIARSFSMKVIPNADEKNFAPVVVGWILSFFSTSILPFFISYCHRFVPTLLCVLLFFIFLLQGKTITIVNSLQTFIIRSCRSFVNEGRCRDYLYYKYRAKTHALAIHTQTHTIVRTHTCT